MVLIPFPEERQVRINAKQAPKSCVTFINVKTVARKSNCSRFAKLHVCVPPLNIGSFQHFMVNLPHLKQNAFPTEGSSD